MLKLYVIPVSLYCAKLRILLRYKKLDWEEVPPPGGYGSDEYKQVVPSGNLPALQDGDLLLGDSETIAEYLEEKFPTPAALPKDTNQRAKLRELSRFHDTRLEPELRKLFPHIRPENRDKSTVDRQADELNAKLTQLSILLQSVERPSPDHLTLADCGFPISFAWMDLLQVRMEFSIEWPGKVREYRSQIEAFPAIAHELADYIPKLSSWLVEAD
ncbi:MAG: glutathione S-transferase family protein [Pseudomonadota bacterium]